MAKGSKTPIFDREVGKPNPYPSGKANSTGSRGGFPGYGGSNGGTARSAATLHKGDTGSGHNPSETKRSSMTGYTPGVVSTRAPGKVKAGPGTIGSTGGKRGGRC